MRRLRKTGKVILIALFWLGLWTLLAQLVHLDLLLPSPLTVARRFVQLVQEPVFWRATLATLLRILSGFFIGMLSGLLLAVLMHISRVARSLLAPLSIKSIIALTFDSVQYILCYIYILFLL